MTQPFPPVDTADHGDGDVNPFFQAALDAAMRDWRVFPLRSLSKRPALHGERTCLRTGDCAAGHVKWEQRATDNPDRIERTWAGGARFNVGIATGPSNLVVVDLDRPKPEDTSGTPCGVTTFKALCERAGQVVPDTYRVRTPSEGWHLYFTAPNGVRLPNTAGALGPLIDTRGWGGYVVAAGSATEYGSYAPYGPWDPAPLPAWLHALLTPRQPSRAQIIVPAHTGASRRAAAALEAETAAVATAPEGTRNTRLLAAARAMGRFVAWGDIPRHVVEEAFQGAGESAGLPTSECRATVASALNWSIKTCRPREAA